MMLGRPLWLIGHAQSDGRQVGGRSDIGRVIILEREINRCSLCFYLVAMFGSL